MNSSDVKILDIFIDVKDTSQGVLKILQDIRPLWNKRDIVIEKFSGGFVNHMLCCHLVGDEDKTNAVTIRVFGQIVMNGENVIDRDYEIMGLQLGMHIGICQPVYAIFKNGIVYGYAPGRTLEPNDLKDPNVIRSIGKALARISNTDLTNLKLYNIKGDLLPFPRKVNMFIEQTDNMLEKLPDVLPDPEQNKKRQEELQPKQWYKEENKRLVERLDAVIPMTLCHNDFHINNQIYDIKTKHHNVIDFELLGFNYEGWDIMFLLGLAPLWKTFKFTEEECSYEYDDYLPFVRAYLEEKYLMNGKDPNSLTELDVKKFQWQIILLRINLDFTISYFNLSQLGDAFVDIPGDALQISIDAYKRYMAKRDFFFNSQPPE